MSFVQDIAQRVEDYLQSWLKRQHGAHVGLNAALDYGVLGRGKRLRAFWVLETGSLLRVQADLLPLAGAVELVHAYSLIHDDLPAMDNATLRRGMPACHRQFGEALAILGGDALIPLAFQMLLMAPEWAAHSPQKRLETCVLLAQAIGPAGMVAGQAFDVTGPFPQEKQELCRIQQLKTGALIQFCFQSVVNLAQVCEERALALKRFACALGLAFQIADDLMDLKGAHETGKDSQTQSSRATWVTLLGHVQARSELQRVCRQARDALDIFGTQAQHLRETIPYACF